MAPALSSAEHVTWYLVPPLANEYNIFAYNGVIFRGLANKFAKDGSSCGTSIELEISRIRTPSRWQSIETECEG